jgi:hypothetical protein
LTQLRHFAVHALTSSDTASLARIASGWIEHNSEETMLD